MSVRDGVSEGDEALRAAAETAASWARARRATWTSAPLASAQAVEERPSAGFELLPEAPAPVTPPVKVIVVPPPVPEVAPPAPVITAPVPSLAPPAPAASSVPAVYRPPSPPKPRKPLPGWLVPAAAAVVLLAAAGFAAPYVWNKVASSLPASMPSAAPAGPVAPAATTRPAASRPAASGKGTGTIKVTSSRAAARVQVDGKPRGLTPATLDIAAGRHEVTLSNAEGTVRRTVTVAAGEVVTIDEAIFAGWAAIEAPFDLAIAERGKVLRADDRGQVMLPPGVHELQLSNTALGFRVTRQVEVKPGETTKLLVTPEASTLTVTASAAAEVWIDGARAGETPLNAAPVPLGTHEVVVRRTGGGGERRFTVTIGAKPSTLNVDF